MFAVTNVDDLLILALFFGQARTRSAAVRIVLGQYAGFTAILAVSVLGALGAGLLPESVLPYLGILPLVLGLRAAWNSWRHRATSDADEPAVAAPGAWQVAAITFANGGDNLGVYVPVFATTTHLASYVVVFLLGVAVWCAAGFFLATRPLLAQFLNRWGHILLPVTLVAIGVSILI
jgi:cadmium resistance protein CadD (predicted permease)